MNKPILKVHIGLPKTGTTYIQTLLKKNRTALLKEGILYPLAGLHGSGHSALAANYLDDQLKASMRKSNIFSYEQPPLSTRDNILYEQGLTNNGNSSVILSAEGLAIANLDGVKRFAENFLPYFEIQIIVFLRRQDFMAESIRAQAYRVNQATYNPRGPFDSGNISYNYTCVLDCWSSQFSEESITVVEYPENQGSQALKMLTVDLFGLPNNLEIDNQSVNERLGRDILEYVYTHSKLLFGTRSYFKAIRRLSEYTGQNPPPSKYRFFYSPQERLEILDIFRESNAVISKKYKSDLFSSCPPIDLDEEWEPYPGLTELQVVLFDKLLADIADED